MACQHRETKKLQAAIGLRCGHEWTMKDHFPDCHEDRKQNKFGAKLGLVNTGNDRALVLTQWTSTYADFSAKIAHSVITAINEALCERWNLECLEQDKPEWRRIDWFRYGFHQLAGVKNKMWPVEYED